MDAQSRTQYDFGPQQHRSSRVASVLRASRLHQIQNAARLSEAISDASGFLIATFSSPPSPKTFLAIRKEISCLFFAKTAKTRGLQKAFPPPRRPPDSSTRHPTTNMPTHTHMNLAKQPINT